jgi:hypothetical protein
LTALCERCGGHSDDEIMTAAYQQYRRMGLAVAAGRRGVASTGMLDLRATTIAGARANDLSSAWLALPIGNSRPAGVLFWRRRDIINPTERASGHEHHHFVVGRGTYGRPSKTP